MSISSTNYFSDDEKFEASANDDDCGSCKKDDCQFMCAICLEDFVTDQDYENFRMSFGTSESVNYTAMVEKANLAGLVLPCMHKFHSSCLKKHIEVDVLFFRCPLCSTYIPTILASLQGYIRDSSVMHAKSDEDNFNLIYRGYEALVKGRTPPTQVIAGLLTMSIDDYDSKIIVPVLVKEILGMMEIQDDRFKAESLVGHSCVPHGRKMKRKIVRTDIETRAMNEEAARSARIQEVARSARIQASAMAQMEEWESRRDYARREINVARSATIRRPERRRATGIRSTISQIFTRSNLREDQPVPPPSSSTAAVTPAANREGAMDTLSLSESISNRFRRMLSQVRGRLNSTSRAMRRNSTPNMRRDTLPERPSEASTMTLGRLGYPF